MTDQDKWLSQWLDDVAAGSATMSQRSLASIARNGGLDAAVRAARARKVHLVKLTDDTGKVLIAASRHPFRTLC